MNLIDRLDFALAVFDHFLAGVAWYARQKRVRWIMWYRPWVVLPDLWCRAVAQVRDRDAFRRWKIRVDFLFRGGQWQAAMSEVADAFRGFEADVNRFAAASVPSTTGTEVRDA